MIANGIGREIAFGMIEDGTRVQFHPTNLRIEIMAIEDELTADLGVWKLTVLVHKRINPAVSIETDVHMQIWVLEML